LIREFSNQVSAKFMPFMQASSRNQPGHECK
jgi:hypothetical protein